VLLAVVTLWGCNDSDDIVNPDFDPADVQAGAEAAGLVGPTAEMTEQIITGLMQGAFGAAAPMTAGGVIPTHETSVYLENGVEATCEVDAMGGLVCQFFGTVSVDGYEVSVSGSLSAGESASQPASGTRYDVDFDATATSALANAVWSTLGTVEVDEQGEPVDYSFNMSHTVTPTGGSSVVVTAVASPSQFELVVTGPMGGTVRMNMDRVSMTGSVYVNGYQVATFAVDAGCTDIDFTSEEHQDVTICPQD
jgi:hypothetical protein